MSVHGTDTAESQRLVAGRYRLREMLGRGGMGRVWRAEDELLRRSVAVKEISFPPSVSDEELAILQERTLREARAAARIDSPAAVRVYDVVEDDGKPCIVMELVEGRTLRDVIREDGPLTPAAGARVGLALVDALESAHAAGIVHRDVKPGNVLVRPDGRVILTDFGIARTVGDTTITSTGLLLGSPSYISPERARGGIPLPASDMWSLGATLFTAVEGRPPFDRGEPFATLAAVVGEPPTPYVGAGPLAPVLDQLLDKDPAARPTPAAARRLLAAVAADPASERTDAVPTATVPLAPAERTIVLPPAPQLTNRAATRVAPSNLGGLPPTPLAVRRSGAHAGRPTDSGARLSRMAGVLAVLLLFLALGAVAALMFLLGGNRTPDRSAGKQPGDNPATARTPGPAGSRTLAPPVVVPPPGVKSTGPTATGPTRPEAGLPPGWVRYSDPTFGWSFAHPANWSKRIRKGGTEFVDPNGYGYVRVDRKSPAGASAVGDWLAQEKSFAARYPGYHRLQLTTIPVNGYDDAAIWEFTFPAGGVTRHAVDLALVTHNTGYAVYFQTADSAWASSQDEIKAFFASFRPGR